MIESSLDSRVRRKGVLSLGNGEVSRVYEVKWFNFCRMQSLGPIIVVLGSYGNVWTSHLSWISTHFFIAGHALWMIAKKRFGQGSNTPFFSGLLLYHEKGAPYSAFEFENRGNMLLASAKTPPESSSLCRKMTA